MSIAPELVGLASIHRDLCLTPHKGHHVYVCPKTLTEDPGSDAVGESQDLEEENAFAMVLDWAEELKTQMN